jgi:antirestriction protein ArdC
LEIEKMRDVYQEVTNKIIAALETGVAPWHKPWVDGSSTAARPIRANGETYNGINVVLLWSEQSARGYASNQWMTFKQAITLGGCVRKGEKGAMVVYADRFTKTRENAATGEDETYSIPFMKAYTVFNVAQIDGLPLRFYSHVAEPRLCEHQRNAQVDAFVAATGAVVRHGGNRAFFTPSADYVQMPDLAQFDDAESYYGTLLHEITHWSGDSKRLDRIFGKRFGDDAYAAEELVAELGSAFLCADLQVTAEPRADHASYIASWLRALRNDKRCIFTASAMAQRAADYLAGFSANADEMREAA